MKNLIYILIISLTVGCITGAGTIRNQTNWSSIEHSISDFQNNFNKQIITNYCGVTIRQNNLINLFINNDLYRFNFGTLMPEVEIFRDHIIHRGGENKMVSFPKLSNSELKKRRTEYYAAKRRVDSLVNKVANYMKTIESGKKQRVRVDKVTRDKTIEIVKLTDVQIKDMKRKLVAVQFELMVANDELKEKDFGFSQATGAITEKFATSRQEYRKQKADEKIENIKALINSAVMNGSLQNVLDVQNLAANDGDIKQIKSELMKIVRKENKNGYPIKNLSFKAVEIVMAGLLNWNTEKSEQPFPIS